LECERTDYTDDHPDKDMERSGGYPADDSQHRQDGNNDE
jgi:hypothetical protein